MDNNTEEAILAVRLPLLPLAPHGVLLPMVEATLPGMQCETSTRSRWFRPFGSVWRRDDGVCEVFVGGVLVGTYQGAGERNVLLVKLSEKPRTRDKEAEGVCAASHCA